MSVGGLVVVAAVAGFAAAAFCDRAGIKDRWMRMTMAALFGVWTIGALI